MAVIGKIRKRSTLLLVFVGLALAAFVLGDLFKNLGKSQNVDPGVIGKINGEKIAMSDFNARMDQAIENVKQQQGKENITNEENYQIMTEVWNQMLRENIMLQQCINIGLAYDNGVDKLPGISMKEFIDLIKGDYPHPFILQNFSDPQTGRFDKTGVEKFLAQVEAGKKSTNPEEQTRAFKSEIQWKALEDFIKKDRLVEKYNNLVGKAFYMPKALAEVSYKENNLNTAARYFAVRYSTINDSTIKPTDADFTAYYEEHKYEFEQKEETRNIDYIVWNVKPSAEDIKMLEEDVASLKSEFITTTNDEALQFAIRNSDSRFDTNWIKKGSLPVYIDSLAFNSAIGSVFGPWTENEAYHLGRLIDVQARPDSMRASHILISYQGAMRAAAEITRTSAQAKLFADSLLKVVKTNGAAFEELAGSISDDMAAKEKNGDLDWFADGNMVPAFNDACIKGKVGDMLVVETPFGFHVIKITGKKDPIKKVKVAMLDKKISFTPETYNDYFNQASKFASMVKDTTAFDTATANQGLQVMHSSNMRIMDQNIQGLSESRKIVQWAFNENTEEGKISDIFDFDNKLVIAVMRDVKKKGILPLEDVKEYITVLVIREVKARQLMGQLKNQGNDINAIALKHNVLIDTVPILSFATYSLPTYGPEPNIQGRIPMMKENTLYGPLKGEQGVFFVIVDKITPPAANPDNYSMIRMQAQMYFNQRISNQQDRFGEMYKAIEDKTDIEDLRHFFY